MPIPERKPEEDKSDFLSRCMSDETLNKEYPDASQRYAVCMTSSKGSQGDQVKDAYYDETYGHTEIIINEEDAYIPEEDEYEDFGEEIEYYSFAAKPGLWENIRKKKQREGKNYKPAKPGDPDRPTPEQIKKAQSEDDEEAEALQYGKPSKNDPRKTPAPKKDQKKGSKKNKPKSAKDDKGKITFSKNTIDKLKKKVTEHNAKEKGTKATLGMLKAVYRRGAGAYSTSHAPKMSRDGWAMARVNAFLYLLRNGRPSNPNYKQDNDLLPKSHPKSSKASHEGAMQISQINKMSDQLMVLAKVLKSIEVDFQEWTKDHISKAEYYVQSFYDSIIYPSKDDGEGEGEEEELMPSDEESCMSATYEYENPKTGEIFLYRRKGNYRKDGTVLTYVGRASEYQGRKVKLNKPFRTPKGPKKFSVYVKNEKGNVVKVNFGDPDMKIKKNIPERRKSFRARHQCDTNPGPKWKARYWSCKMW